MRRFGIIAVTLLLIGCGGSGTDEVVDDKTIAINLEVSGADGMDATLVTFEDGVDKIVDSAKFVGNTLTLETDTKELRQYLILIGNEMPIVLFLDDQTSEIKISGAVPGLGSNYEVEGSQTSAEIKEYLAFVEKDLPLENQIKFELQNIAMDDSVSFNFHKARLDSISALHREYAIAKIMEDSTDASRWLMLREMFPPGGLADFDSTDLRYFHMIANGMKSRYPTSEYPMYIEKDIESLVSQMEALKNPPPPPAGQFTVAPEIELNDFNGKPIALSSLQGKVVLIDFWASWCAPCRQENPNVVKAYNKWKDKGFTIYSVSLDENRDKWMQAIDHDNLSWPNHVSDLKGWMSPVVQTYGVDAIPSTFLIDQQGTVIGRNLRGGQLEQKLQEILG